MSQLRIHRVMLFIIFLSFVPASFAAVAINGAGSTFIYPVLSKWTDAYSSVDGNVHFTYQSIGSLQGIDQLLGHTADFAASDAPLHLEQMHQPGCATLYFPAVTGAVVVIYNLPSLAATERIRLTAPVLAAIYLGKIRKWNDPAIVTLNPGAAKLDDPIMVNYRQTAAARPLRSRITSRK